MWYYRVLPLQCSLQIVHNGRKDGEAKTQAWEEFGEAKANICVFAGEDPASFPLIHIKISAFGKATYMQVRALACVKRRETLSRTHPECCLSEF